MVKSMYSDYEACKSPIFRVLLGSSLRVCMSSAFVVPSLENIWKIQLSFLCRALLQAHIDIVWAPICKNRVCFIQQNYAKVELRFFIPIH